MASIDLNSLPSDGKTKVIFDPATAEVELRINPFQDVPEPPAVIKVIEGSDVIPSFTRGNFSLIMGKAKSRKTFFCALLVSSFLAKNNEKFRAQPQEKPKVLWFDTEQSRYHLYKTAKRIKDMVGDVAIMNLEMFALRTRNTSERREFIDYVIRKNASAGLIIIDGIRDLVNDINSAQESTEMATTLLQWTAQQDTHIINVLHQNKADNNARGHLGTELTNKAETVISITADDSVSIVEAEYTREMSFKKFGFRINEASLPELCDTPFENKEKPAKTDPNLHPDEKHLKVLNEIFKANQKLKYNELCLQIKIGFQRNGLSFGVNRSREYLVYYKTNKWIEQEDGSQFYKYTRAIF